MARPRSWTWTVIISLLVGALVATIFWLYSPYGYDRLAKERAEALRAQTPTGEMKEGTVSPKKMASQAVGSRFQMVTDGKQVFVVDLKSGRAWRYFHQTKEEGFSREDEGFLPIPFYYAGKKHYSASDIDSPSDAPGNPVVPSPEGKQPQ
ncbi:MAG: hypothetical protein ACOZFS_11320 [Thermodesulfobacteriota bacterium]